MDNHLGEEVWKFRLAVVAMEETDPTEFVAGFRPWSWSRDEGGGIG